VCFILLVRGSIGLRIFAKFGLFELKPVTTLQILSLAACYALCTPLSNLSLAFNSVGFYQMMKILTTPYVAVIESVFYGAKFTTPIKISLAIVTVGVLMASVNDVEVSCGVCALHGGLCVVCARAMSGMVHVLCMRPLYTPRSLRRGHDSLVDWGRHGRMRVQTLPAPTLPPSLGSPGELHRHRVRSRLHGCHGAVPDLRGPEAEGAGSELYPAAHEHGAGCTHPHHAHTHTPETRVPGQHCAVTLDARVHHLCTHDSPSPSPSPVQVPVSALIVLVLVPFLDNTGIFFEQANSLVNYEFTTVGAPPCPTQPWGGSWLLEFAAWCTLLLVTGCGVQLVAGGHSL
jgi:hypothetical protein